MSKWIIGQRCASTGEPSLGLGMVIEVSARNVRVNFAASETMRTYAVARAPLRRVRFEPGETVKDRHGVGFWIESVEEKDGLLYYVGKTQVLPETDLNDSMIFSRPHQKLLAGQVNVPREFDLRADAWSLKNTSLSSPGRGFHGARIEWIPHQVYIAMEVAGRHHPRVLLSDEVGLGKTIEAGLIFHRLWITGEVKRVLCLVPGQLVTQWLTEFYRKFNVLFSIMNADQAKELAKIHPDMNPYLAHQCVIQELETVCADEELRAGVLEGDWDLVIVDEAHHLFWSEDEPSEEYLLMEDLSAVCGGILLLTATPRQLGLTSHFGRLRLLDPERFNSLAKFREEADRYGQLADIANRVLAKKMRGVKKEIGELFPEDGRLQELTPDSKDLSPERIAAFCRAMIDRHGTGRMVFRNHRRVLSGYPKRLVFPVSLETHPDYERFIEAGLKGVHKPGMAARLLAGAPAVKHTMLPGKAGPARTLLQKAWRADPRVHWLLEFLRANPDDKFLLICSQKSVVLALQEWFGLLKNIEIAVFHEDLNLLERDRQAAYFAKSSGARLLICSEIGSEGRNFQFAHKLILFDLPINPALLEQRIGRLDRIGQKRDVEIYVPYSKGSPLEMMYRWYQQGLDAFEHHLLEGDYIYEHLKGKIFILFDAVKESGRIEPFIEESRIFTADLREKIEKGRDRLLELNSFDAPKAQEMIETLREIEHDPGIKRFMDRIFDLFGVHYEDQDQIGTQIVKPTPQMSVSSFPGLNEDGAEITYDRDLAIVREELTFLSHDHPMVTGAIDILLNLGRGTTSFALWRNAPEPGILVQFLFVFECQGGDEARLSRYLPPVPILLTFDQNKKERSDLKEQLQDVRLEAGPVGKIHQQRNAFTGIVSSLLAVAEKEAETRAKVILNEAGKQAMDHHKIEYDRLKALLAINPSVHEEELDYIEERLNIIFDYLEASKTRLDSVRLILMIPG